MASTNDMVAALNAILEQLKKMNTTAGNTAKTSTTQQASKDKSLKEWETRSKKLAQQTDKLTKDFDSLDRSADKAKKAIDDFSGNLGTSLVTSLKKSLVPGYKIVSEGMKKFEDSVNKTVKSQDEHTKGISAATASYIKTNNSNINNVRQTINAYKDYIGILNKSSKEKRKLTDDEKKQLKQTLEILENYKDGSGKNAVSANQLALSKKLIDNEKLSVKEFTKLNELLEQTNKDFSAMHNVAKVHYDEAAKYTENLQREVGDTTKKILNNIKTITLNAARISYNDTLSQAKNAVGESQYFKAGQLGVSQGELSEFIGENRLALRAMGGGKASAPIENGQINHLQNTANNFGLTGNEALKFIGKNFDNAIKMGVVPTTENLDNQMNALYKTMQQTGMTFDQLNEVVSDLADSPAFLSLVRARGYDTQQDIVNSILTLNKTEKYSMGYLKGLLDLQMKSQYQGIESYIKNNLAIDLQSGFVNSHGGNISASDKALLHLSQQGVNDTYIKQAFNSGTLDKSIMGKYKTPEEVSKAMLQAPINVNKEIGKFYDRQATAGGGVGAQVNNSVLSALGLGTGISSTLTNTDEYIKAAAARQGTFGTENPTQDQFDKLTAHSEPLVKSLKDVDNAFISLLNSLGIGTESIVKAKTIAEGILKNPVGQSSSVVKDVVGDVVKGAVAIKGIGLVSGLVGGSGAAGAGAGAAALGTAALGATGVAAAGGAGYALGTGINKAPELFGGQDISTYIADLLMYSKDKEVAEMMKTTKRMHSANVGAPDWSGTATSKSKTSDVISKDLTTNPITPEGMTMGDLLKENSDKLQDLIAIQKKQLDVLVSTHDEYMDYLTKMGSKTAINNTRVNTYNNLSTAK